MSHKRRTGAAFILGGFLALAGVARAGTDQKSPPAPVTPAPSVMKFDVNDCRACHEKQVANFEHTRHMKVQTCDNCHGDVVAHLKAETDKQEKGPIVSMKTMAARQVTAQCLTCHDKARQADWTGGVHDRK